MPPRKRKASAKTAEPVKKKVRVGETSIVAEPEELPSRPKRASIGTPQYNFTRTHKTAKKQADDVVKVEAPAVAGPDPPKRRGRPAKNSNTSLTKTEPTPTARTSARGRPAADRSSGGTSTKKTKAKVVEDSTVERKRGRPRKSDALSAVKEELPKTAVKAKKSASKTAKVVTKVAQTGAKGTEPPRKRGRPSKKAAVQVFASLRGTNLTDISDADDVGDQDVDEEQGEHQYWLMKAEPNDRFENGINVKFSIDDLAAAEAPEPWDGVRNYGARNNMRAMRKGDLAFFYHSNCAVPGIVGVMRIVQEHSPDKSAFDSAHPYFDPKSVPSNPRWDCVHVEFVKKFDQQVTLKMLQENKNNTGELANMQLLRMGRLSVSAVTPREWEFVLNMANEDVRVGEDGNEVDPNDGYEGDTDGEVEAGPKEELNGDVAAANSTSPNDEVKYSGRELETMLPLARPKKM